MARFDIPSDVNNGPAPVSASAVPTPAAVAQPITPQTVPPVIVAPIVTPALTSAISGVGGVNPVLSTLQAQQAIDSSKSATITAETDRIVQEEQILKQEEHWIKAYWRPAMGWLYMAICLFDFIIFPAVSIFLPIIMKIFGIIAPYKEWQSLTLSNGGLIHLAFGAILGVSAWSRGQEKMSRM